MRRGWSQLFATASNPSVSGSSLTSAIEKAAYDISPKWIKAEGYDNYSLEPR
jgi:hypothetical protein